MERDAAAPAERAERPRVVVGVIGDDIHTVGNRIMQLALEESGYRVFNLRTRNRPEHFCQAALEVNAHALFVSSLNGEGEYWCTDFRQRLIDIDMGHVLLYVGGNIVVGSRPESEVVALFKGYGFDRVYHQRPDFDIALLDLAQDLKKNGASQQ